MDQLETLKREWQAREQEFPQLTFQDIYQMLLKKSSSMVKWIFYISIGELVLWTVLSFFIPESSKEFTAEMGLTTTFRIVNGIGYVVFAIFIYLFYKNYQSIQVTDNVKSLMENILKTRRTVKYFVIYNIGTAIIFWAGVNVFYYMNKDRLYSLLSTMDENYAAIPIETFTTVFFVGQLVGGLVLIGLLLLFYRLIYGILLKRLKTNYKELKKMEI